MDLLTDPTQVGHKFARQEMLRRAGFTVPAFFCVPVGAFDNVVSMAGANPDAVRAAGVRHELARSILERFDQLVGKDGLVAVRACVVADADGVGEDGARDPFAGLTDSFLHVRRGDVLARIADCWASAFNPEAMCYRELRGMDPLAARVAVGVQQMVLGTRSFVAFSRDPRDGGDRCVIAAVYGTGEGVVAEKADIDHFFVEPSGVRAEVVLKTRLVGPDSNVECVPDDLQERPVLDDATAVRIKELARDVEAHFGRPQDIEGSITPDGVIHLVQARPAVSPAGPASWTNHNVTESFPGLTCALTFSQARVFYRAAFGDFYRRMGVRADDHDLSRMIALLDHRVYYRLDSWYALHGSLPAFEVIRSAWERSLGLGEARSAARPQWGALVRALPRLAWLAVTHPRAHQRFLRWWDSREVRCDGSADELIRAYRMLWAGVARRWGVTIVNSYFALGLLTLAGRLVPQDVVVGLLAGGQDNRSLRAVRSAVVLAGQVREHPRLRDAVLHDDERTVWAAIAAGEYGDEARSAFAEHVRRYGDRAAHDLKLEVPTPRQHPWTLLATLRPLITAEATVPSHRCADLREVCRGPLRRAVVRVTAVGLRGLARAREDARFCRSELYGRSRTILWRLGEELAEAGQLEAGGDVVHLTVDEVLGAFDGTLVDTDLRGLVALRKKEFARSHEQLELPVHFTTDLDAPVTAELPAHRGTAVAPSPGAKSLHGLASSLGRVRGPARVVLDPTEPGLTIDGGVLVARETDPGWLPLMVTASAMVVERGSPVSHTAITGRLLGIPTVVGVAGATTVINDGAVVEVDGTTGTVWLDG